MKLFKKLAAAALAAVLALSMVGCGAGGTGSAFDLKNEVLNAIEDSYGLSNKVATHTTTMDAAAAKLIEGAAKDGAEEDNKDTVKALLKKQTIDGDYIVLFAPYGQLLTELGQNSYVEEVEWKVKEAINHIKSEDYYDKDNMLAKIGNPEISKDDPIEIGAATGKIKGKSYLVLLVQNAKA